MFVENVLPSLNLNKFGQGRHRKKKQEDITAKQKQWKLSIANYKLF